MNLMLQYGGGMQTIRKRFPASLDFGGEGTVSGLAGNLSAFSESTMESREPYIQSSSFSGNIYSGVIVSSNTSMSILAGEIAYDTTVQASGIQTVKSGGSAIRTTLESNGIQGVSSGGCAISTNIVQGSYLSIASGGLVSSAIVNSGGYLSVGSGAYATNTVLKAGGSLTVFSGGSAVDVDWTPGTGPVLPLNGYVSFRSHHSGCFLGSTARLLSSAAVLSGTKINSSGNMCVMDGGIAQDTVLYNGTMYIYSGGIAQNTRVQSSCNEYVFSGGIAEGTTVVLGSQHVFSNGVTEGVVVSGGGQHLSGGTANGTEIRYGHQWILQGGVANSASVYGYQIASSGGLASQSVIHSSGLQQVVSGGTALGTILEDGGAMYVAKGGIALDVTQGVNARVTASVTGGDMETKITGHNALGSFFLSMGYASNFIVYNSTFSVDSFGVAANTLVLRGGTMYAYSSGTADGTHLQGNLYVYSSGIARNTQVESGGRLNVSSWGQAYDTTILSGGSMYISSGTVENVIVHSGGTLSYDGHPSLTGNIIVGGTLWANDVLTVSGCTITLDLTERTQDDGVMVYYMENLQTAQFQITVSNSMYFGTYQLGTISENQSRNFTIYNVKGEKLGSISIGGTLKSGNTTYSLSRKDDVLSLSLYTYPLADMEIPTITQIAASTTAPTREAVTVSAVFSDNTGLASTQYKLGDGAWTDYTGAVTVTRNTTVYFKAVDTAGNEASAQYEVTNIDTEIPSITQIAASTTAPTREAVTVSAVFSDNTGLASTQYKLGDGAWTDYTGAVTVTRNTTVYFKAVDTAGNEATVQYGVINIDAEIPSITQIAASTTAPTREAVTVSAVFGDNTGLASTQYKLGDGAWTDYTGAVTVTRNTTVYFKAVDTAGNEASAQYVVSNINTMTPGAPSSVVPAVKVGKYAATIKWSKSVAYDSARIIGYEVKYNGNVSAVKGTSLSLKNLAVGTGNTVEVRAFDSLGRYGEWSQAAVFDVADVTSPTLGKVTATISGYTGVIAWSGADNVGIVGYVVNCAGRTQTVTSGGSAQFDNLAVGKYSATVQAFDAAGNASKIGKVTITVKDSTPPDKVAGLNTPVADSKYNALLSWTPGSDNSGLIAGYEIRLDNGKILKSSKNSLKVSKLSAGSHSYQVRAIDKDKNIGEWSEVKPFTVDDMTAPKLGKITAVISGYSGVIYCTGSDNVGIVRYVVNCDGQTQTVNFGDSAQFDNLAVGKYSAAVQAFDAAGNGSKIGKITITVKDTTPPEKVVGLNTPVADSKYNALLTWTPGSDNSGLIAGYEIRLENGKIMKSSTNSLTVSKLSIGSRSYQVRAIDKDKNIGEWSEVKTFTVGDMSAPAIVPAAESSQTTALAACLCEANDSGNSGFAAADAFEMQSDLPQFGLNLSDAIPSVLLPATDAPEIQNDLLKLDQALSAIRIPIACGTLLADFAFDRVARCVNQQSPFLAIGG